MGRRKERRLAALSAAGRRVKLDLSAHPEPEPESSLAVSSCEEEGGDQGGDLSDKDDHNNVAGFAIQSSSSLSSLATSAVQKQENPLSLLGQYSDNEAAEEEEDLIEHNSEAKISTSSEKQDEEFISEVENSTNDGCVFQVPSKNDTNENASPYPSYCAFQPATNDEQTQLLAVKEISQISDADVTEKDNSTLHLLDTMHSQGAEGLEVQWRAVMDEQSNQFYYWNIKTGETTWVKPSAFIEQPASDMHATRAASEQAPVQVQDRGSGYASESYSEPELEVPGTEDMPSTSVMPTPIEQKDLKATEVNQHSNEHQQGGINEACPSDSTDGKNGVELAMANFSEDAYPSSQSMKDTNLNTMIEGDSGSQMFSAPEVYKVDKETSDGKEDVPEHIEDPNRLISCIERLCQRFKMLDGTGGTGDTGIQGSTLRLKYALEAEIRLADCKALLSCGFDLRPFWAYTAVQLKRLNSILSVEEAAASSESEQGRLLGNRHLSATPFSLFRSRMRNSMKQTAREEIENPVFGDTVEKQTITLKADVLANLEDAKVSAPAKGYSDDDLNSADEGEQKSLDMSKEGLREGNHIEESNLRSEKNQREMKDAVDEDVEMEVDMDVEEQTAPNVSHEGAGAPSACEFLLQSKPHSTIVPANCGDICETRLGDDALFPPQPCDEDYVPPPPPDAESIPPPPPDEPPPYPSPSSAPAPGTADEGSLFPVLPYQQQYTTEYGSMPSYGYYPTAIEVGIPNYYAPDTQTDGVKFCYYDQRTAAYTYHNPAEAYYYNSGISAASGNDFEHSAFHAPSGANMFVETAATACSHELGRSGVTVGNVVSSEPTDAADTVSCQALPSLSTSGAFSSAVGSDTISVGQAADSGPTKKIQNKVVRNKKKSVAAASGFRSNKKVSSLVDKWKAAKEELHGSDEDNEGQNPVEYLERKRQREIEEWRMQQIASGEAQDNANFQPLGGDWREKVKRKKLEAAASDQEVQASIGHSETRSLDSKPDVLLLSKGLPDGWQAFFDESSGQVYYGNLSTSETTWERPV